MTHHQDAAGDRSTSEIMAEARDLQARHAPRMLDAAARRLHAIFTHPARESRPLDGRQITVH